MSQIAGGEAGSPASAVLEAGAEALRHAAGWLAQAGMRIEAAGGDSDAAELLAEEVRDVLARVKAEREKLVSTSPDA